MNRSAPERDPNLSAVAQLLERERPVLTFDERERLDRRLKAVLDRPMAPRRRGTRLSVVICLAVGLLFMTAGTGLAISGFATSGAADHAQYPDRMTPPPRLPAGGKAPSQHGARRHHPAPSSLGQIPPAHPGPTDPITLTRAETHDNPPFTGYGAIPILLAGVVLIIRGAAIDRRSRGRPGPR